MITAFVMIDPGSTRTDSEVTITIRASERDMLEAVHLAGRVLIATERGGDIHVASIPHSEAYVTQALAEVLRPVRGLRVRGR